MTLQLAMLRGDARLADATTRHAFIEAMGRLPAGALCLATCHRVEVTARPAVIDALERRPASAALQRLDGEAAARHLLRVAVGLESAVLGEDQVLHQLRTAVARARAEGPLDPGLDHLVDVALRAGRQVRSWLPAGRPSLADVALEVVGLPCPEVAAPVLVVGAGSMGALAARALRSRRQPVLVASRTPDRARRLAQASQGDVLPFDPGPGVAIVSGIVVALSGRWPIARDTIAAIGRHVPWLIDLSFPPAVPSGLVRRLGRRFVSIDDLAGIDTGPSADLRARMERLVERGLADVRAWDAATADRDAARGLAALASSARDRELSQLWNELQDLDPVQREAVERMAERLTRRLLRDPLERLGRDRDGRYRRAARDLFLL